MVKTKRDLLKGFLGAEVSILTTAKNTVQLPDGEFAEVPLIIEGYFQDYDDEYLLVAASEWAPPELIARSRVINISQRDTLMELMKEPGKPPASEMN